MPRGDAKTRFTAIDNLTRVTKRISKSMQSLEGRLDRVSKRTKLFNNRFQNTRRLLQRTALASKSAGRTMTVGLTLPVIGAGISIFNTAVQFQKSINKVGALTRTIIKGKVTKDFKALESEAQRLGSSTEFSAIQAADAMGLLGRAGFKTKEIISTTENVLALASSTGFDLAFSADVMAKTMRTFGFEASQSGRVADVFAEVSRSANVDLETLAETMKITGPIAKAYGSTLEETAAITGFLGNVGIQGTVAGTALKNIMLKLTNPSKTASKIFKKLGVSVADADGNMRNVGDIIADLAPQLAKFPKQTQLAALNELFGLRGIAGGAALMEKALSKNPKALKKLETALKNSAGVAKEMRDIMLREAPGAIARFNSALEGLKLKIAASGLLDSLTRMIDEFGSLFSKLSKISPEILDLGVKLGLIAAVAGPLLIVFGVMASSITSLMGLYAAFGFKLKIAATAMKGLSIVWGAFMALNPVGQAVLIVGAITLIATRFDFVREKIQLVVDAIRELLALGLNKFTGFVNKLLGIKKLQTSGPGLPEKDFGPPIGARNFNKGLATNTVNTNNAAVSIDIPNLPQGSRVRSESDNGFFSLNVGRTGSLQ